MSKGTPWTFSKIKEKIIRLLRWSEQYTKIDMVYLASGGFWLLLTQGIISLSAFAVTITLTRLLPPEVFGEYRFALSLIPMLAIFTLPGMAPALTRAVARGAEPNLWHIIRTKIRFGILGTLASLLLALYYFHKGNTDLAYIFMTSSIFIPFYEAFLIYSPYLKGKMDFKTPSIYETISRIAQAAILIAVALLTHSTVLLILTFLTGQILTQFIAFLTTLRKNYKTQPQPQPTTKHPEDDVEEYGKKLFWVDLTGRMLDPLDKFLVWHFFGAKILAFYIVIFTLPFTLARIIAHLTQLSLPKLSTMTDTEHLSIFTKKTIQLFVILFFAYIILTPIFHILYQYIFPKYLDINLYIINIASLIIIIQPINVLFNNMLTATKKVREYAFNLMISIIVYILLFIFIANANIYSTLSAITLVFISHKILLIALQYYSITKY